MSFQNYTYMAEVGLPMEKIEDHAVIEFLFMKGVEPKQILEQSLKVYKNFSPSLAIIYNSVAEIKRGRTSLENDPRQRRRRSSLTTEITAKIQDMILKDHRLTDKRERSYRGSNNQAYFK